MARLAAAQHQHMGVRRHQSRRDVRLCAQM
jgi:hypothetical protein